MKIYFVEYTIESGSIQKINHKISNDVAVDYESGIYSYKHNDSLCGRTQNLVYFNDDKPNVFVYYCFSHDDCVGVMSWLCEQSDRAVNRFVVEPKTIFYATYDWKNNEFSVDSYESDRIVTGVDWIDTQAGSVVKMFGHDYDAVVGKMKSYLFTEQTRFQMMANNINKQIKIIEETYE